MTEEQGGSIPYRRGARWVPINSGTAEYVGPVAYAYPWDPETMGRAIQGSPDYWQPVPEPCPWHDRGTYARGSTVEQLADRPVVICGACGERLEVPEAGTRKVYRSLWDRFTGQNAKAVQVYQINPILPKLAWKVG